MSKKTLIGKIPFVEYIDGEFQVVWKKKKNNEVQQQENEGRVSKPVRKRSLKTT
jgi:hypothetical protein